MFVYGMNSKEFHSLAIFFWVLNLTFFPSSIHSALIDRIIYCDTITSFKSMQTNQTIQVNLVSVFSSQILPHHSGGDTAQLYKEGLTAFPCFLTACICSCFSAPKICSLLSPLSAISSVVSRIFQWHNTYILSSSACCWLHLPKGKDSFYERSIFKISQYRSVITSTAEGEIQLENRMECKGIFPPESGNQPTHLLWRLLSVSVWFN